MSEISIVVVGKSSAARSEIAGLLRDMGYQIAGEIDDPAAANLSRRQAPDLFVLDAGEGTGWQADAWALTRLRVAPLLLLGPEAISDQGPEIAASGVMSFVLKPARAENLRPAVEVALQRYRQLAALDQECNDLREQLEALQLLERAQGVLMSRYNLDRGEAFRRIDKASRDVRRPIGAIARAILGQQANPATG